MGLTTHFKLYKHTKRTPSEDFHISLKLSFEDLQSPISMKTCSWIFTTNRICQLNSHGEPISDTILYHFLFIFFTPNNIPFLDPSFLPKLEKEGWQAVWPYFTANRTGCCWTLTRPFTSGEHSIAIPCHISGSHLVTLVHREINGHVYCLYSDYMKNPSIERHVHNLIFNTNEHFVHQELLWAKDLDRFDNPSETIFLPYMHPIIFNITRTWVTVSIIQNSKIYRHSNHLLIHYRVYLLTSLIRVLITMIISWSYSILKWPLSMNNMTQSKSVMSIITTST